MQSLFYSSGMDKAILNENRGFCGFLVVLVFGFFVFLLCLFVWILFVFNKLF